MQDSSRENAGQKQGFVLEINIRTRNFQAGKDGGKKVITKGARAYSPVGAKGRPVTQHIYANETSYAGQQREAARNFRQIARALG